MTDEKSNGPDRLIQMKGWTDKHMLYTNHLAAWKIRLSLAGLTRTFYRHSLYVIYKYKLEATNKHASLISKLNLTNYSRHIINHIDP